MMIKRWFVAGVSMVLGLGLMAGAAPVLVVAAEVPASATTGEEWRLVDLEAGDDSEAVANNDRGHVVGHGPDGVFLWRNGEITHLNVPGRATDLNNRDEVVGATHSGSAFLWRDGVMIDLGAQLGSDFSLATAINDRGDVVGYRRVGPWQQLRAFRWRAGVVTDLGAPPDNQSLASDVNNAGMVVGKYGETAVRWRHHRPEPLLGYPAHAEAVNDRGDVAGYHWGGGSMGNPHGFLWRHGQVTQITQTGSPSVMVYGINNWAQVVGVGHLGGFVWQQGTMTRLPGLLPGLSGVPYDINDRGQVVGASATQADGLVSHAVVWTQSPGPRR